MYHLGDYRRSTPVKRSVWETGVPSYFGDKQRSFSKMASIWVRSRLKYCVHMKVSSLIASITLFVLFVLAFKYYFNKTNLGFVQNKIKLMQNAMSQKDIDKYLGGMHDTRPSQCNEQFASADLTAQVSIIMDYKDEEFHKLKLTLSSIIRHSPDYLIKEIILLDDGSSSKEITAHANSYLKHAKSSKIKVYRSEQGQGQSASRLKATKVAKGSILVFLSCSVVVNEGWLEPLVKTVFRSGDTIAVPHHDNLLPGYRFFKTDNTLVHTFSWTLSTVLMESSETTVGAETLDSPVMRGDAFAVSKSYLESLGSFDDGLDEGGGHDLELSLRTWMCGGNIKIALCSRVAVQSAMKPKQVDSVKNFHRISEMWFGDFKSVVYKQGGVNPELSQQDKDDVVTRKSYFSHLNLKCKPFSWYLNEIVPNLIVPNDNVIYFGKLKVTETLFCSKSISEQSAQLELVLCRPYIYESSMIFEMDNVGNIKLGDRCMQPDDNGQIELQQCREGKIDQTWELQSSGRLVNRSKIDKCLTQNTHRDERQLFVHIMKLEECSHENDKKQLWSFINY